MLSLIHNAIRYVLRYAHSYKDSTKEDINEIISQLQSTKNPKVKTIKTEKTLNEEGCYYRTGCITFVATNYVLIDNNYMYEKNDELTINLKVGDKVYYLAYLRDPNAELKVRKIIYVIDDLWNDDKLNKNIHNHMIPRTMIARVAERKGRIAVVEPNNISIDLNKVQSDFIPFVGDWLILESLVELNSNFSDLCGEILEVNRIKPLRSRLDVGVISKYDGNVGIINKRVIFHKHACEPGYIPCVGDKVVSDTIESTQGAYGWRSITVVPLIQISNKSSRLSAINNSLLSNADNLLENKNGIIIDDELNFNLNIEEESVLTVSIQNNSDDIHVLQGGSFMTQKTPSQLSLVSPINRDVDTIINPSESVTYTFECKAKFIGTSDELFIFNFKNFKIGRLFHIMINARNILPKTDSMSITQNKSQQPNVLDDLDDLNEVTFIPGIKVFKLSPFKVRQGFFKIPQYMWDIVLNAMQDEKKSQMEREMEISDQIPSLLSPLSHETYRKRFHVLLYLEEIAQRLHLQQYNIENTFMRRHNDYLVLKVPGLVEKRPSLLVGDRAIVSFPWDKSQGKLQYEGFIHQIKSSEIFLKFNEKFHQRYNNEDCHVKFKCSHVTISRCHNAVNQVFNSFKADFLFPTKVVEKEPQFHFEEYEVEEKPTRTRVHYKHNESVFNNNFNFSKSISSESNASFGNAVKTSPRLSVAERLFNVKSIEPEETKTSTIRTETNKNLETNLMKSVNNGKKPDENSNKTNIPNTNVITSKEINKLNAKTDNELEPYVSQIKKRKLNWFNQKLNYYQKEAVRNILKGLARPLPYVIFGPPGTGKTITLCEAILQILTVMPESRILVATPSNSSANLIAERLLDSNIFKPGDLVRLVAYYYMNDDSISERLLPYCTTVADGIHEHTHYYKKEQTTNCTLSVLGRHRITISTCTATGLFWNINVSYEHFSHIVIDEAGQATEPEIMIPLNFISPEHSQVILAGDPMQLGPVVQSKFAQYFGLGESFLSRLLHQFPYQKDLEGFETHYDPRLITKLVMNYRSLPEILELPNSLFYESELQSQISPKDSEEAEMLEMLKAILPDRNGSPPAIVFHGVKGENYRDSESPSWYNLEEATQVYLYLLKLYKYGLEPDDIGIITPYQKQVLQIRNLLSELAMKLPKISSVEGFQGQERKVIILSTVRSCNTLVNDDIKHTLGFIASPKRLNVAITRARALLIIVGNPELLVLDPYWKSVLIYCINHDAYTGCNFLL